MKQYNITQNRVGQLTFEVLPINFLSFIGNFLVIFLTFTSPELKEHSRFFIANTAFLGLAYTICSTYTSVFLSGFHYWNVEVTVFHCTLVLLFCSCFDAATMLSYAPTIICRFYEVTLQSQCSKLKIFCLILYPYSIFIPYILYTIPLSVKPFGTCYIFYNSQFALYLTTLIIAIILISFSTQMFLSMKLYVHLKRHFMKVSANLQTNQSVADRLKKEKSILMAVFIQGVTPVILASPLFLEVNYSLLFNSDSQIVLFNLGCQKFTLRRVTSLLYNLNPLIDSLCVIFIMIPYVRARRRFTGACLK